MLNRAEPDFNQIRREAQAEREAAAKSRAGLAVGLAQLGVPRDAAIALASVIQNLESRVEALETAVKNTALPHLADVEKRG